MKTTCSRARQLEIATSLYSPAKGLRAIYCLEKNTWSRIRGVESGSQVIGRGAISPFHSYYLWKFRSFLCFFFLLYHYFVILIKYSRAQRGKKLFSPVISPSVALELKGYLSDLRTSFVSALWKIYKTSLKGRLKLNEPRHSLMLGANHSLQVIGVGFQLYGQLKKSPHDGTGVLGSTAVSTVSQSTRLGKGSSVIAQDEHMP